MRGPVYRPVHHLKQLAGRTIRGNRIWRWLEAIECIAALCVSMEYAAEIILPLVWILLLVETWTKNQHGRCLATFRVTSHKIYEPLVEPCQTSTVALARGFPVCTLMTLPCM